jgi:hypothetical protein
MPNALFLGGWGWTNMKGFLSGHPPKWNELLIYIYIYKIKKPSFDFIEPQGRMKGIAFRSIET